MPTRTARTSWTGTLEQGVGKVELTSSKIGTYDVSFPKRAADDAGGWTSPEELIAAAHSACYAMQLSALIGQAGGTPQALDVQADVSLGPDPARRPRTPRPAAPSARRSLASTSPWTPRSRADSDSGFRRAGHYNASPPSTGTMAPVMALAPSPARNASTAATSAGRRSRPMGCCAAKDRASGRS